MALDFWNDAERRTNEANQREQEYLNARPKILPGGSQSAYDVGQQRLADKTAQNNIYGGNVEADRRRQQIGITDLDLAYKRAQEAAAGTDRYSVAAADRARQQYGASMRGGVALASSVPMAQRALAERRRQAEAAYGYDQNENAIAAARAAYMSQAQERMAELAKARAEANIANVGAYSNEYAEQAKQDADRRLYYTQLQEERARQAQAAQANAANARTDMERGIESANAQSDAALGGAVFGAVGGALGGPVGAGIGGAFGSAAFRPAQSDTNDDGVHSPPSKKEHVFMQAASRMAKGKSCR